MATYKLEGMNIGPVKPTDTMELGATVSIDTTSYGSNQIGVLVRVYACRTNAGHVSYTDKLKVTIYVGTDNNAATSGDLSVNITEFGNQLLWEWFTVVSRGGNYGAYEISVGFKTSANISQLNYPNWATKNIPVASSWGPSTAPSIRDLYQTEFNGHLINSVTFAGIQGQNGVNNPVSAVHIYYHYNSNSASYNSGDYDGAVATDAMAGQNFSGTISIPNKNITSIAVRPYTISQVGDNPGNAYPTSIIGLKFYSSPAQPESLKIEYSTSKPTPTSDYTFSWNKSVAGESNKVDSYYYEIRIKRNNIVVNSVTGNTNGNSITLNGKNLGIAKGDRLQFQVKAIGTNPNYNSALSPVMEMTETIENAGIVRIKVGNNWVEGQVYVRPNNTWIEAESVYIKPNSTTGWKESM